MNTDRRSFLRLGVLAACAAVVPTQFAVADSLKGAGLGKEGRAVLDFTRRYASEVRVVREGAASGAATRMLVRVDDLARFARLLPEIPFANVYAQGNSVSFALAGRKFTIENVTPEVFAMRRRALRETAVQVA